MCGAALLYELLRVPAQEIGNIMGDYLRDYRLANLEKINKKHQQMKKDDKLTNDALRPISPKLGIPLLNAASLEENDALQGAWARLLTNAVNPNFKKEIRNAFINILESLSPVEVAILQGFYEILQEGGEWETPETTNTTIRINKDALLEEFKLVSIELEASLLNLERCQLITTLHPSNNVIINNNRGVNKGEPSLTALGVLFIQACVVGSYV